MQAVMKLKGEPSALLRAVVDSRSGRDASIPAIPLEKDDKQVQTFGLPFASSEPVSFGSFVCAVDKGASVNCPTMTLCAHSNGTHTECVGHILPGGITLQDVAMPLGVEPALLVTVEPVTLGSSRDVYPPGSLDDLVIDQGSLALALCSAAPCWDMPVMDAVGQASLAAADAGPLGKVPPTDVTGRFPFSAVCIRTTPNPRSKMTRKWTKTNPPYITGHAMSLLRTLGVRAVLLDLPSADREDDGGQLIAHRTFFQTGPKGEHVPVWELPVIARPSAVEKPAEASGGGGGSASGEAAAGTAPVDPVSGEGEGEDKGAAAGGGGGAGADDAAAPRRPPGPVSQQLITELCYFGPELADGPYALSLQVAPVALDAAPSRPVLFPAKLTM